MPNLYQPFAKYTNISRPGSLIGKIFNQKASICLEYNYKYYIYLKHNSDKKEYLEIIKY